MNPRRYREAGIRVDPEMARAAVYGGSILGGGGGGWIGDGLLRSRLALDLGEVTIVPVDALPDDAVVATVSAVGSPGSKDRYMLPVDHIKAFENLLEAWGTPVEAIATNENGASTTVNGWLQAAVKGLPVVDAPGDGRAHPTAEMGSCGLWSLAGYESTQSAVGGNPRKSMRVELVVRGGFQRCAALVRQAAIQAGGVVAVARDPLPLSYLKANAARGALGQAMSLGSAFLRGREKSPREGIEAACEMLKGEIAFEGTVTSVKLEYTGGFDVGSVVLDGGACEIAFWNEYMTLEIDGERLATLPDLIMTFDLGGEPLVSAAIKEGQAIYVIRAPKESLILGAGMKDPRAYEVVERVIGKQVLKHSFPQEREAGT